MKEFLRLNNGKLWFGFKFTFIGFVVIFSALFFLPIASKPGLVLGIIYDILASLVLALLLTLIIFTNGFAYHRAQENLFDSKGLTDLLGRYKFKTAFVNAATRWHLTQVVKTGQIDSYSVIIFKTAGKRKSIGVAVEVDWRAMDDRQIKKYQQALSPYNWKVGPGAMVKTFRCSDDIEEQIKLQLDIAKRIGPWPAIKKA